FEAYDKKASLLSSVATMAWQLRLGPGMSRKANLFRGFCTGGTGTPYPLQSARPFAGAFVVNPDLMP
ncbi:MAG TPA: hypothetical protein VFX11_09495, partial [Candidatus Kapabacteria bacterium]|nr:hypothetical protein [Candidatus Kapabacteria bacterium]